MPYLIQVNALGDKEFTYSAKELVDMYIAEGKTEEEAKKLVIPLRKFLYNDAIRQRRSWYKSHWERCKQPNDDLDSEI